MFNFLVDFLFLNDLITSDIFYIKENIKKSIFIKFALVIFLIKMPKINHIFMKYTCTNCRYVYNPYFWDEEQEIEAWTDFFAISEDRLCPVCGSVKDDFIELIQEVNEPWNIDDMIPQEEQHIPFYKIENDKVIITIWTEDEPFVKDDVHFVEYVWIYDEYWELIDWIDFPDTDNDIIMDLPDEEFEVRASCSLHWIWKWINIS